MRCAFCGSEGPHVKPFCGWAICDTHRVLRANSKYENVCNACGGPIAVGDPAMLCKIGARWRALHPLPTDCERSAIDPDLAALHLLPSAPREVVRAVHKALALALHPDRGGDLEQMQAVNAAFDRLARRGLA